MKTILFAAGFAAFLTVAAPAFADDLPPLPNDQWTYVEGATTYSDPYTVTTTGPEYNQATIASGGHASTKNKANFQDVTTTTYQDKTTTYDALNPAGVNVDEKDATITTTVVLSTTTEKRHVK